MIVSYKKLLLIILGLVFDDPLGMIVSGSLMGAGIITATIGFSISGSGQNDMRRAMELYNIQAFNRARQERNLLF